MQVSMLNTYETILLLVSAYESPTTCNMSYHWRLTMCEGLQLLAPSAFMSCWCVRRAYRRCMSPHSRHAARPVRANADLQLRLEALPWIVRACGVREAGAGGPDVDGRPGLWGGRPERQVDRGAGPSLLGRSTQIVRRRRHLQGGPHTSTGASTVVHIDLIVVWSLLTTAIRHHITITNVSTKSKVICLSTRYTSFVTEHWVVTQRGRVVWGLCWHLQCNGIAVQEVTLILAFQDCLTGIPVMGVLQVHQTLYTTKCNWVSQNISRCTPNHNNKQTICYCGRGGSLTFSHQANIWIMPWLLSSESFYSSSATLPMSAKQSN
jgi:hypothetical protein